MSRRKQMKAVEKDMEVVNLAMKMTFNQAKWKKEFMQANGKKDSCRQ